MGLIKNLSPPLVLTSIKKPFEQKDKKFPLISQDSPTAKFTWYIAYKFTYEFAYTFDPKWRRKMNSLIRGTTVYNWKFSVR